MTLQDERPATPAEWAARTVYARRRARFIQLLARARKDVTKDSLPLIAEEWEELAAVYTRAAEAARLAAEETAA